MSEVSNRLSEVRKMRELVTAVAGPRGEWGGRDRWFEKAARLAGLSYRQVRAVYYGEITDPENISVVKLKEAAGKYESERLAEQFDRLVMALQHRDEDFHREDINSLLVAARTLRGLDRTGVNREGD